ECLPPLMPSVPMPAPENLPAQPEWNTTFITEEAAREAFISCTSSKCCYRSAPAREGVITSLEPFNTYRNCHACNGTGKKPCKDCAGSGN
ncbi:protein SSUH2 isoform X2, partial [Clarias magur]